MKVEAFNSELNPFSIENLIKSEPSNAHANDSGYSAHSESGSEADNAESISPPRNTRSVGYDRIPNYSHLPFGTVPHVGAMGQSQAENAMFKNLLIYSNFIQMVQVRIYHFFYSLIHITRNRLYNHIFSEIKVSIPLQPNDNQFLQFKWTDCNQIHAQICTNPAQHIHEKVHESARKTAIVHSHMNSRKKTENWFMIVTSVTSDLDSSAI